MRSALQVSSGVLLMLFGLLDVFLTVLYARAGTGLFSRFICAWEWRALRRVATLFEQRAQLFLSLCGPAIVASLISWWALLLTLGAALIFHPYLGSDIAITGGRTPTDFVSAMYAAANSMSIVGSGSFSPQTSTFRLIFMVNSLIGMSVISLTLTYLMQIYNALQQRNALGLHLFLLSGMTGNGAELLIRIAPQGRIDSGFSTLSDLAFGVTQLKEIHHFYPVLLYFRFEETYYSVSFVTSMLLDCVCLIESAINAREYEWLRRSGTLEELWAGSVLLLDMIHRVFSPAKSRSTKQPTTESEVGKWKTHYLRSVDLLKVTGFRPAIDVEQGAKQYIGLRQEWAHKIEEIARYMLFPVEKVVPDSPARARRFGIRSYTSLRQSFRSKEG